MRPLITLQTAFSLWMLYDAAKRRADSYWYFIILMPFGPFIYFALVKFNDPEFRRARELLSFSFSFARRPSLDELRYRARSSPSQHNRTLLAAALADRGEHREALELYRSLVESHREDLKLQFAYARVAAEGGETSTAIEALQGILTVDFDFSAFDAASTLAALLWKEGKKDESVDLLRRLCRQSQRLPHHLQLGEALITLDHLDEARVLLEKALEDFDNAPEYVRKQYRAEAHQGRKMLKFLAGRRKS